MGDNIMLPATKRDRAGKGAARAARREGMVPGVIYGDRKDPISVSVELRLLMMAIEKGGFFTNLVDLDVEGDSHRVIARDIQLHPVSDRPIHIDFLRVSRKTRVAVEVPVHFLNEEKCEGLKRGGILNIVRHAVELYCPADAIPDEITLDLAGWDIGDSIHISAFTLPDGVEPTITDRDFTVATIAAPGGGAAALADDDEEASDGDAAEPAPEG